MKKYTNEDLLQLALKYNQRNHFRKENSSAYAVAFKRGILNEICNHMGIRKNEPYSIDELKIRAAKYNSRSEFERKDKKAYSSVINRKLGLVVFGDMPYLKRIKYTKKEFKAIFSSCYSLRDLYIRYGKKIPIAAKRMGCFEEMKLLFNLDVPKNFDSWENIEQLAKKYKKLRDFKTKEHIAYLACERLELVQDLYNFFHPKKIKKEEKISFEKLQEIAFKYVTKSDFKKNDPYFHKYAKKNGLLNDVCRHMICVYTKYSISDILEIAKKYNSLGKFLKEQRYIYGLIKKYGIFDKAFSHIKRIVRKKYTDQELLDVAKNFKYRSDVIKNESGVYSAIFDRGLESIAFSHMPYKKFGRLEDEVRKFVEQYFECKKLLDSKVKIYGKNYIKKFEIDIYVPSLNKGIEFDGTYWHSFNALKKQRPKWSKEDIENYEKIKDEYFKTKGIHILHIKEKEWLKFPDECKNRILFFLKGQDHTI